MEMNGQLHASAALLSVERVLVCTEFQVASDGDGLNPVEKEKNLVTLPGIAYLLSGRSARSVVITPTNNNGNVTVAMFIQLTALAQTQQKYRRKPRAETFKAA
jgi:hypothetical protein